MCAQTVTVADQIAWGLYICTYYMCCANRIKFRIWWLWAGLVHTKTRSRLQRPLLHPYMKRWVHHKFLVFACALLRIPRAVFWTIPTPRFTRTSHSCFLTSDHSRMCVLLPVWNEVTSPHTKKIKNFLLLVQPARSDLTSWFLASSRASVLVDVCHKEFKQKCALHQVLNPFYSYHQHARRALQLWAVRFAGERWNHVVDRVDYRHVDVALRGHPADLVYLHPVHPLHQVWQPQDGQGRWGARVQVCWKGEFMSSVQTCCTWCNVWLIFSFSPAMRRTLLCCLRLELELGCFTTEWLNQSCTTLPVRGETDSGTGWFLDAKGTSKDAILRSHSIYSNAKEVTFSSFFADTRTTSGRRTPSTFRCSTGESTAGLFLLSLAWTLGSSRIAGIFPWRYELVSIPLLVSLWLMLRLQMSMQKNGHRFFDLNCQDILARGSSRRMP